MAKELNHTQSEIVLQMMLMNPYKSMGEYEKPVEVKK
jgi:hypothetical protein